MNSDSHNLYSISDLAEQVGVPRTTITDWLGKYARFIELQTQGRRRFYTDRTLSVLCKVAELRTAGRSIGDIDGELERIFPVHPTVEPPASSGGPARRRYSATAAAFTRLPVRISDAPEAAASPWVPALVVWITVFPSTESPSSSAGELPQSAPGMGKPFRSPNSRASGICRRSS